MTHWPSIWCSNHYFLLNFLSTEGTQNSLFLSFQLIKELKIELKQFLQKNILWTSDSWSMSRLFHRPSNPAYYIEDWRILSSCVQQWPASLPAALQWSGFLSSFMLVPSLLYRCDSFDLFTWIMRMFLYMPSCLLPSFLFTHFLVSKITSVRIWE